MAPVGVHAHGELDLGTHVVAVVPVALLYVDAPGGGQVLEPALATALERPAKIGAVGVAPAVGEVALVDVVAPVPLLPVLVPVM